MDLPFYLVITFDNSEYLSFIQPVPKGSRNIGLFSIGYVSILDRIIFQHAFMFGTLL